MHGMQRLSSGPKLKHFCPGDSLKPLACSRAQSFGGCNSVISPAEGLRSLMELEVWSYAKTTAGFRQWHAPPPAHVLQNLRGKSLAATSEQINGFSASSLSTWLGTSFTSDIRRIANCTGGRLDPPALPLTCSFSGSYTDAGMMRNPNFEFFHKTTYVDSTPGCVGRARSWRR